MGEVPLLTLNPKQVLDPDGVWPASFRPYHELADYIISLS